MNFEYESIKSEYTSDPFNIPEKLYAYYKANAISAAEAISYREKIANSLVRGGFIERTIPQGRNATIYRELMDLLNSFGFDHNYSVDRKRKLLREIGDSVVSRLDKEAKAVSPAQATYTSYYNMPRTVFNNSEGEEEFVDPDWNTKQARKNADMAKPIPGKKARRFLDKLESNSNEEEIVPVPQRSEAERQRMHSDFRKSLSATLHRQRENETNFMTQLRRAESKALKSLPGLPKKKGGNRTIRRIHRSRRQTRRIQNRRK
jgi:hypothetical protein